MDFNREYNFRYRKRMKQMRAQKKELWTLKLKKWREMKERGYCVSVHILDIW